MGLLQHAPREEDVDMAWSLEPKGNLADLTEGLPAPLGENRAVKAEPTAGLSTRQQEHKASRAGTSFPLLPLRKFKSYALKQGTVFKHCFYILWSRVTSFTRCPGLPKIKSLQIQLPNNPSSFRDRRRMQQVLSYHPGAAAGSILSFIPTQKLSLSSQANRIPHDQTAYVH